MVPDAPVRVPEMQDTPPCRAQKKPRYMRGFFRAQFRVLYRYNAVTAWDCRVCF